jgi:hypothetical protein
MLISCKFNALSVLVIVAIEELFAMDETSAKYRMAVSYSTQK